MKKEQILAIFQEIADLNKNLKNELALNPPHVDLEMNFPKQEGLKFNININLQGDELHLNASNLWIEWFPCDDEKIKKEFIESVSGLLSGEYRMVEYLRGEKPIKTKLQKPENNQWKTIGIWSKLHFPISWKIDKRVVQNL